MFNGKSFNEKYLLTRKHYDFTRAINCTCKLTCVCAYVYVCNHTRLREQYELLFFILGYFCPFTAWTIKISKKWKKTPGDVNILHKCTKNDDHYTVPEIWHMTDVIYFSFWAIFCPFTLNSRKNQNFKKMKKMPGDIIILYISTKNYDYMMHGSWDMVRYRRMDKWKDGKSHT